MPKSLEVRMTCGAELRASGDGRKIEGYAAVFNSKSEDLGGFREVIKPGAFSRTVKTADVRCLFNHSPNHILGRTKSGTLSLSEDSIGLKFVCDLPKTSIANDLHTSIKRGDVSQCSFGFIAQEDNWPQSDLRELIDVDLFDVSPVTYPAYPETSAEARAEVRNVTIRGEQRRVFCYPAIGSASGQVSTAELEKLTLRISLAMRL